MLLLSESDLLGVRHLLATCVAMPVRRSDQVLEDIQAGVTAVGPSAYHGCEVTYSVCGRRKDKERAWDTTALSPWARGQRGTGRRAQ